jgi:putative restriction endonuclease
VVYACCLIPFADAQGDTIIKEIALSPNRHRAFDRGLVSVSNDYRVQVYSRAKVRTAD